MDKLNSGNRRRKKIAGFLLAAFLPLLLFGAEEVKIVSLSPALTEIICRLGAQEDLIGRSSACNYPEEVIKLPVMGSFAHPSLERLAASGATLVVADVFRDAGDRASIERLGIEVLELKLHNLEDYRAAVKLLGEKIGRPAAAAGEIERIDRTVGEYRRRRAEEPGGRPKVLFIIWHDPVMIPGKTSFLTELIALAGGVNIGEAVERDYFRCSEEYLLQAAPAVIVYPGSRSGGDGFSPPPSWGMLPAVKNRKIFRPDNSDIFLRLGPRLTEALAELEKYCVE